MLQNLNDRLASYIQKVHSMAKENERLDKQIKEWYMSKTVITHEYSAYLATIADLQDKIRAASTSNAMIYLEIDNSKLAAEDFRMKYEHELSMTMAVEGDIAGLRRIFDNLYLTRKDLENHYKSLKEELIMLKKNHKEPLQEMGMQKTMMAGQVNVEVDAPSPVDLNQIMTEIREHYEGVITRELQGPRGVVPQQDYSGGEGCRSTFNQS
ncbi:hypothetical protein CHARACLAT_031174 [Characodon lateralis]|uniref:IF rod domain-containing protein n=1 Tax=Characodon lateralis TaxID=208331 RepID=A0ABU7DL99_9TELE|nr:hypothetical protein [Characodon lateralis]